MVKPKASKRSASHKKDEVDPTGKTKKSSKQQSARGSSNNVFIALFVPVVLGCLAGLWFSRRNATTSNGDTTNVTTNPNLFSADSLLEHSGQPIAADLDKRAAVTDAFKDSWAAYKRDAWGKDNHHPVTQGGSNIAKDPIGYFIVDCLDMLLVMGLHEEYEHARQWIHDELTFEVDDKQHAFEVTIRVLGGLLSAYHMSGNDTLFLDKAVDLGDRLLPIFDTPSGIPHSFVNLATYTAIPDSDNNEFASVAEAGTLQLEMRYLSELTGDPKYWTKAKIAIGKILKAPKKDGLVPLFMDPKSGQTIFSDIRLGSRADSFYEYLVKLFVQSESTEEIWQMAWMNSLRGIQRNLLARGVSEKLLYTQELVAAPSIKDGQRVMDWKSSPKQDHLVCFLPGTMLLGLSKGGNPIQYKDLSMIERGDLTTAAELLNTCVKTYEQTETGLGAEIVFFRTPGSNKRDSRDWYIDKRPLALPGQTVDPPYDAKNMLRPETLESLFVAYRLTHNQMYRDQAWAIFEAFDKHCRLASGGFATIRDVDEVPTVHEDRMETFWIAESLKYLYLIFSGPEVVPLDQYVLSTEAHILPQFAPNVTI